MQSGGQVQKLVTADGTYATQSAFSSAPSSAKKEERYGFLFDFIHERHKEKQIQHNLLRT